MDLTRSLVPSSTGYFCVLRFDSWITTASDVHTKATLHFSSLVRDIIHVAANSYGDGSDGRGGKGVTWANFIGCVPLASQNPCPIIVYCVANN